MIAGLTNLVVPDLLIVGLILMVLGTPVFLGIGIALILRKRGKKPPPLPKT